ncbi:uncharacterized protein ANIA_11556 [Aspergillus nidulans FGSC A4]|uniref:Uncharacterized protein n=1 Tax=Emericella nidulans (strain FGSC A4 / ATCC 38163 / CBS 112.46 / NRRL 194 / M139) TaxID=227321 RepID=C8VCE9_EMENI|nr:hypothetical protein [Aspergillus nidulans FGSC A4]CBF78467.1 TPA: hypothetical protein ANIA_11556 [Aspergillus nidulans FGSC A4]
MCRRDSPCGKTKYEHLGQLASLSVTLHKSRLTSVGYILSTAYHLNPCSYYPEVTWCAGPYVPAHDAWKCPACNTPLHATLNPFSAIPES